MAITEAYRLPTRQPSADEAAHMDRVRRDFVEGVVMFAQDSEGREVRLPEDPSDDPGELVRSFVTDWQHKHEAETFRSQLSSH